MDWHPSERQIRRHQHGDIDPLVAQHLQVCTVCEAVAKGVSMHLPAETSAAYVTGDLTPEEQRQVEAHLGECPTCGQEVLEIRSEAAEHPVEHPTDDIPALRERLPRFWGRYTLGGRQEARLALERALGALQYPELASVVPTSELIQFRALLRSRLEALEQNVALYRRAESYRVRRVNPAFEYTAPIIEIGAARVTFRVLDETPDSVKLEARAERQSGKPAKNIQVRLISRPSHDGVHEALTDSTGVAQFELDHGEYRVEVEHEILGAGSMLLDV